jgi:pilus assembly protein CpaB
MVVVGVFALLLAAAGGYLYFFAPGTLPLGQAPNGTPTPEPDVEVVQAAIDIDAGTLIGEPDELLKIGLVPAIDYNAAPDSFFRSAEELRNLKTLVSVSSGEPLRRGQVGPAGLAMRMPTPVPGQAAIKAFPIQVNALTGVADMVQIGDFVDVLASFNLDVTTFRPGAPVTAGDGASVQQPVVEQIGNEGSVKVLLQDVEVLDIVRPAPPAPTPEGGSAEAEAVQTVAPEPTPQPQQIARNTSATTLQDGNWVLVIGVTNQEAEIMRFALDRGIGISTLLRRAGDHTTERTVGSTLRILIDHYGMPVPNGLPPVQQPGPVQIPNVPSLPETKPEQFAPAVTPEADQ